MKRLLPHPVLSLVLAAIWLLLNVTLAPGHVLLALGLGLALPILTSRFWPNAPRIRRHGPLLRYLAVFLYDVVVANIQVAGWILRPQHQLRPRFLFVPLEVRHPFTITVLTSTISLTPGTVSSHISADRRLLIVHCLHTDDDEATVRAIKERYERPLKEIFG